MDSLLDRQELVGLLLVYDRWEPSRWELLGDPGSEIFSQELRSREGEPALSLSDDT